MPTGKNPRRIWKGGGLHQFRVRSEKRGAILQIESGAPGGGIRKKGNTSESRREKEKGDKLFILSQEMDEPCEEAKGLGEVCWLCEERRKEGLKRRAHHSSV